MKVHIRLFAHMAAQAKTHLLTLEVPAGANAAAVEALLKTQFPDMRWAPGTLVAVNQQYAAPTQALQENDEVAFIPPVSGEGAGWRGRGRGTRIIMNDPCVDIRLLDEPLDVPAAIRFAWGGEAAGVGGIDVFIGITRGDSDPQAGEIQRLDYHAYPEMALKEIRKLIADAQAKWPIVRVALWHRLGPVRVGEASVVIAVGCPHRAPAFAACRFLIDQLKETVPIWKKDIYSAHERWQSEK